MTLNDLLRERFGFPEFRPDLEGYCAQTFGVGHWSGRSTSAELELAPPGAILTRVLVKDPPDMVRRIVVQPADEGPPRRLDVPYTLANSLIGVPPGKFLYEVEFEELPKALALPR